MRKETLFIKILISTLHLELCFPYLITAEIPWLILHNYNITTTVNQIWEISVQLHCNIINKKIRSLRLHVSTAVLV